MKFGAVPVARAEGAISAHSVRHSQGVIRKGQVLLAKDIEVLANSGIREIVVARLEKGDVHEDKAATLLAEALDRGRPMSLLIMDIDFFKSVNDTHGHDVGDEVIREFARRLQRNTRGIDMTCRFGGEEFIVVMPDTDISLAIRVAERVRRSVADEPFAVQNGARFIDITTSAGVATIERLDDTRDTLIKRADQALYSAKRHGRNRVVSDAA